MNHDEFAEQMTTLSQEAQRRLSRKSRDKRYWEIAQPALIELFQKYRNANLSQPERPHALVVLTFGFVQRDVIGKMNELYLEACDAPSTWPAVVQECRQELDKLASEVIADMESKMTDTSSRA